MAPYDVVVIGAGAAGLVTASGAALLGARVALIEQDRFGGECLWTGCVPSKALIRTAQILSDARHGELAGLSATEIAFDFRQVMQSMRDVIARIQPHDDPATIQEKGVVTISGTAEILGPGRIAVDGEELSTKRIVIATGSRPVIPPVANLQEVGCLTHESALELDYLPARLIVLGAGPIGLEFAQIFNRLGSDVTVVELLDTILPREDAEMSDQLRRILEADGVRFRLGHKAIAVARVDGGREITLQGPDGSDSCITADEILVATGMRPFTQGLGLEKVGVELDERGAVRVDSRLKTTASGIWAAGDVTAKLLFTHVADYQARLIVRNMFFPFRARADYSAIPWAIYTDPTLAHVGLTEEEARDRRGDRIGVYRFPFDDLDRAITDRAAHGLVKLITDPRGRILGGHILGSHADAVIHEVALAMRAGVKIGQLSQMVHAYPTWPEGVRRAADSYYAQKFADSWVGPVLRWWARR
ncbi:MAG: mercuric reductase [Gemmatimonadota bacterium]|jgi:pyruvate/2-oxoglutarate dehydrogenase complex dihydrolipoamide dehydrogenase (E3) component